MKIRDVRATLLRTRSIFVEVETEDGAVGLGECSPMNGPVLAHFVNTALRPLLLGEDPRDIGRLWHKMLTRTYKLGVQGVQPEAIAGVDIALWDLLGKSVGLPVYTLLGGKHRERIQMYASIGGGAALSPAEMAGRVQKALDQGFRAFKIRMDWGVARQNADPAKDLEMFRLCRELIGPDMPLSFDANNGYSVSTAIQQGRRFEALGIVHFEEPIAQYDYAGMAQVAAALDVPISAGEHEYTRWQFRDLILQAQVDIVQPDVVKCAGLSEAQRIAVLAETFNRQFLPHQTQPTLGTAANLHLCCTLPHCTRPQEYTGPRPELEEMFEAPYVFEEGCLQIPDRPGLGLTLKPGALERMAAERG